ncbi:exodeoxyribonuclease V subunit alpha [Jannaschia sp. R86511]|uniref:exodeoxyribonuclease V subunit alpha n=1 Tax=Jannaschia sp. R86511 TaxID=3093853 RepID=UPI0036D34564
MTLDAHSPERALRATGLLRTFNDAGVLSAADVHVATRLGVLLGESDETVLLAAGLTVRSTRGGSVVLDLATAADAVAPDVDETDPATAPDVHDLPWPATAAWVAACAGSPLTTGPDAPLALRGSRLWLSRYDQQEQQVVDELRRRTADTPDDLDLDLLRAGLDRLFPRPGDADQRLGAAVCALSRVSVLAGGPGTGKTTTVSRLLALLREQAPGARIALAAPTGKAAARLEEAVRSSTAGFADDADRQRLGTLAGVTLHRLLGWQPGSRSRFRHHRGNRLPFEVVVVDEASMVPLTMMARLLEALRDGTRLVLVGDPDQLASVEAGAVLGDLVDRPGLGRRTERCVAALDRVAPGHGSVPTPSTPAARLRDGIAALTVNHRFAAGSAIGALSDAVRRGDHDGATALLQAGGDGVELLEVADDAPLTETLLEPVRLDVRAWGEQMLRAALAGDARTALRALDRHRLLCAHRRGPRGVQHWEWLAARWLADLDRTGSSGRDGTGGPTAAAGRPRGDGLLVGQPLLVTTNDYEVGLFNGDTGLVVAGPDGTGAPRAVFARGGEPTSVPLVRLGAVRAVHAMTVHRSQGSQFDRVTVVLPTADSPLATRETLYTAITRAVSQVRVIGSAEAFAAAVARPAARATGLRERL